MDNGHGRGKELHSPMDDDAMLILDQQIEAQAPEETPFAIGTPSKRYPFPASIRHVCRKWNDAAIPFVYREVNLKCIFGSAKLDNSITRKVSISRLSNMELHAKCFALVVNGGEAKYFQWGKLFQQLSACTKLQRIRYASHCSGNVMISYLSNPL
jgi:hypothetical protein